MDAELDPVIHPANRLKICAFLVPCEEAEFQVLRDELEVSDSVLSKHLKILETAGYTKVRKGKVDGRQRLWVKLTNTGRLAFASHIKALNDIVQQAIL